MKRQPSFGFLIVVIALLIGGGAGLTSRWQETMLLRGQLELARLEAGELQRFRAENERLRGLQLPAAKLEALRSDHAAVVRLRTELEGLKRDGTAAGR
jgi:hypothetical protein